MTRNYYHEKRVVGQKVEQIDFVEDGDGLRVRIWNGTNHWGRDALFVFDEAGVSALQQALEVWDARFRR